MGFILLSTSLYAWMKMAAVFTAMYMIVKAPRWIKDRMIDYRFNNPNPPGFHLYNQLLYEKFSYYRLLNDVEQRRFVDRLRQIRDSKRFFGRDIAVTEEMEILISASFTQLTFGFRYFDLPEFTDIHILPDTFYSRLFNRDVKGLTFDGGRIFFSWKDFEHGYSITNDGINLGLHELAHAFKLDDETALNLQEELKDWEKAALIEMNKNRSNLQDNLLREYAYKNSMEFWACCVENFFEAPVEFKKKLPTLYEKMSRLLQQDMAERVASRQSLLTRA